MYIYKILQNKRHNFDKVNIMCISIYIYIYIYPKGSRCGLGTSLGLTPQTDSLEFDWGVPIFTWSLGAFKPQNMMFQPWWIIDRIILTCCFHHSFFLALPARVAELSVDSIHMNLVCSLRCLWKWLPNHQIIPGRYNDLMENLRSIYYRCCLQQWWW